MKRAYGVILLILSAFVALGLFSYDWKDISILRVPSNNPPYNFFGAVGAWASFVLFIALGLGAYAVPLWCLPLSLVLITGREKRVWPRAVSCGALILFTAAIVEVHGNSLARICENLQIVDKGGILGRLVMRNILIRWLNPVGAEILAWLAFGGAFAILMGPGNILRSYHYAIAAGGLVAAKLREFADERRDTWERIEREQRQIQKQRERLERKIRKGESPEPAPPAEERGIPPAPAPPAPRKAEKEPALKPEKSAGKLRQAYMLPPTSLLDKPDAGGSKNIKTDTGTTARILVETLAEFGIETEVTNVERGPVVTRYELLPAPGVRIEKIAGLSNNLALSLKATSVRVQAPVPGKGVVGIEVPNSTATMVYLREILEGETWSASRVKLPLALGKDVGGNDLVGDLADMPHLLIAGATGAGKTVCMNSILAGLLMARSPDELRLMLIDPKIVEFSVYNNLPHLVAPVITNPKKVALGLRWAINEMEKRYKLFARVGVRNIENYNDREVAEQTEFFDNAEQPDGQEARGEPPRKIPYIVIIIDELADLMLVDQAEIENCIARLAQLSRAVGIHMILSTQRPSVNVITGTIKANFPARLAFQVAQKVDSRTILDTIGAERLLGRGDMLFHPAGVSKLVRAQGAMTSDNEIKNIVEFIKEKGAPAYELEIKDTLEKHEAKPEEEDNDDEMLAQAVEIIRETRRASTSSLQRRLRIGYTRAARLMDVLEERGIVGPPKGSDPREILIDLDGDIPDNQPEEPEE